MSATGGCFGTNQSVLGKFVYIEEEGDYEDGFVEEKGEKRQVIRAWLREWL